MEISVKFRGRVFNMPADQPWAAAPSTVSAHKLYSMHRYQKILGLKKIEVKCSDIMLLDLDEEVLHLPFHFCHGMEGEYNVLKKSQHPEKSKGFLFKYPPTGGHKRGDSTYQPGGSFMLPICDQPIWVDPVNKQLILFCYTINEMVDN